MAMIFRTLLVNTNQPRFNKYLNKPSNKKNEVQVEFSPTFLLLIHCNIDNKQKAL